jgi:hypothetical protein
MTNQYLYNLITSLLAGETILLEAERETLGPWFETIWELADAPPEWRRKVFQTLDRFHEGELTRLMAAYLPEEEPPPAAAEPFNPHPELPAAVKPDEDLAATACPWLDEYIKFSRHWSPRSYQGYHEACGLWLLSTIAARRVAFNFGDRRYTNLYLIMSGDSTLYAKTRAAKIALDTLKQSGLSWLRAPDRATPQAFLSYLTGQVPSNYEQLREDDQEWTRLKVGFAAQRGWFYEEFGNGIAAMTQASGYMSDFRGLLREFDDCPDQYEYITKARGAEIIQQPYLALLANLTPADLRPVAGRGAGVWGDGFLARFSFITPPPAEISLARFPVGERVISEALTNTVFGSVSHRSRTRSCNSQRVIESSAPNGSSSKR